MPVSVWKKVIKIQHQFLWGDVRGGKKISWVKWEVICKEKSQGGFGVRDIRLVNLSLLSKWRWRLLQPGMPLWKEVLVAKYGNFIVDFVDWRNRRIPVSSSTRWKDICTLDGVVVSKNWLPNSIVQKVGNESSTNFWLANWVADTPLASLFPRLFSLSLQKESMVEE
ncbi:hypothetical protein QL285_035737 [Trifolium repens]|nr:hypothetical protein QL285_035737 [Trifolium repens]